MDLVYNLLLLPFLFWTLSQSLVLLKGYIQYFCLLILLGIELGLAHYFNLPWLFQVVVLPSIALFYLFYSTDLLYQRWLTSRLKLIGLVCISFLLFSLLPFRPALIVISLSSSLFLLGQAQLINLGGLISIVSLNGLIFLVSDLTLAYGLALAFYFGLYFLSFYSHKQTTKSLEHQVAEALLAYNSEVQASHLQMRSWRHDFHNHLQSMKFLVAQQNLADLSSYLNLLDSDLKSVDTMVKSGQLSVDAILNSKLSLAKAQGIRLDVKVYPLPKLGISDLDLTALLGNLLDNAIEANQKVEPQDRFIRIYIDCLGEQVYISIQNAAKQDLSFNERNYISEKRGRHGLGMKRVALVVEKYGGMLNLQNEPGVFAVEASFALPKE